MSFFTWQEIKEISKRIACDTFVKQKKLRSEAGYIKSPDDVEERIYRETADEPDFDKFIIKARNPIDLDKERNRDDLKSEEETTFKQCKRQTKNSR